MEGTGNFTLTQETETKMATLKTMIAALLAGSLAVTAGGMAYAKTDGKTFDPARFQEHLNKRVDKALNGTDATAEQKKQVADILGQTFKDMRATRDQRMANRKAMQEALQAPTIDAAKIEGIRAEQMKIADASSKRFTKALTDAGNVLNAAQRQAFFKNWSSNHERHGKRG
jgi:Spy/CpxP family protein refolding chaperone